MGYSIVVGCILFLLLGHRSNCKALAVRAAVIKKKDEKQKREQRCVGAERFTSGAYLFLELLGKPQTAERRSRENNPFCKGIKKIREEKRKLDCKWNSMQIEEDGVWSLRSPLLIEISALSSASGPFTGAKASRAAREAVREEGSADQVGLSEPVQERVWLGRLSDGFLY